MQFVTAIILIVRQGLKSQRKLFYRPFAELEPPSHSNAAPGAASLEHAEELLNSRKWQESVLESYRLIGASLRGIDYVQRYVFIPSSECR